MRKHILVLAAVAAVSIAGSLTAASASHQCGRTSSTGRNADDRFGSCETSTGNVKCGKGTDVTGTGQFPNGDVPQNMGRVIIAQQPNHTGVQMCGGDNHSLPIAGRVSAYKDQNNNVTVAADGGDFRNSGGAAGWQRYDVRPTDNKKICARRGSAGTYYNGKNGGMGSSAADAGVNNSITTSGPAPCQ